MKKIIQIILAVAVCSIIFLFTLLFEHVKYDTPLSVIESVKYFEPTEKVHAYRPIALTPTSYKSSISKTEVVAKAIYQGDTIGLKFVIMNTEPTIYIESIGQVSNHFVKAISELYEEKTASSVMRPQIKGDCIHSGGFFLIKRFAVGYKTSLNSLDGKNADTHIRIDLPNKEIEIGDRHSGLAKKRFVTVFVDK
ncbi:MAG: hypothetical protein LBH90_00610 [Tannerella sp.]|jgi:uncharacterized protein YxeA|nr:hypothetical protein [Tannerella sp.]